MPSTPDLAKIRFEENLSSPIHRLPNEIIAHIFFLGRPTSIHAIAYDGSHKYPILLGSICQLWRQISRRSPRLWTYVLIRAPDLDIAFGREMLRTFLELSGSLELCVMIAPAGCYRVSGASPFTSQYFDDIAPHLSRICTLFAMIWDADLRVPLQANTELPQLRHFSVYQHNQPNRRDPFVLPLRARRSPLETFHYYFAPPFYLPVDMTTVLRTSLRTLHMRTRFVREDLTEFIESSLLRILHLRAARWVSSTVLSSTTLTHVEINMRNSASRAFRSLGALPNLLHLSLLGRYSHQVYWPELPSLLSLHISRDVLAAEMDSFGLLRRAPQLIALQISGDDETNMAQYASAPRSGAALSDVGDHSRLLRVIAGTSIPSHYLQILAEELRGYPGLRTEWFGEQSIKQYILEQPTSIATVDDPFDS